MAKIYVNWKDQIALGERDFIEEFIERRNERDNPADFAEWLDDNFIASDIWNMDESERAAVRTKFIRDLEIEVRASLLEIYDEIEVNM